MGIRMRVFLALVTLCVTATRGASAPLADGASSPIGPSEVLDLLEIGAGEQVMEPGTNVAQCWRLKSLVKSNGVRDGFEWALSSLKFFEEADRTGDPLTGTPVSSGFQTLNGPVERNPAQKEGKDE